MRRKLSNWVHPRRGGVTFFARCLPFSPDDGGDGEWERTLKMMVAERIREGLMEALSKKVFHSIA